VRIAIIILVVLIGLLSIAAGAAKISLIPDEAEFLSQFGFTDALTITFGAVQFIGGVLLLIPPSRFYGSLIVATGFALSAALLMVAGNTTFAGVSLVPVIFAVLIARQSYMARSTIAPGEEKA